MARHKKHYAAKRSGFKGGLMMSILGGMAYGAVRQKASDALAPFTAKIPLGNISDEVAMGAIAILAKKTVGRKMPLIKDIANAAIAIESARIGEAIITGQVGLGGMTASSSSSNNQAW